MTLLIVAQMIFQPTAASFDYIARLWGTSNPGQEFIILCSPDVRVTVHKYTHITKIEFLDKDLAFFPNPHPVITAIEKQRSRRLVLNEQSIRLKQYPPDSSWQRFSENYLNSLILLYLANDPNSTISRTIRRFYGSTVTVTRACMPTLSEKVKPLIIQSTDKESLVSACMDAYLIPSSIKYKETTFKRHTWNLHRYGLSSGSISLTDNSRTRAYNVIGSEFRHDLPSQRHENTGRPRNLFQVHPKYDTDGLNSPTILPFSPSDVASFYRRNAHTVRVQDDRIAVMIPGGSFNLIRNNQIGLFEVADVTPQPGLVVSQGQQSPELTELLELMSESETLNAAGALATRRINHFKGSTLFRRPPACCSIS